MTVLVVFTCRCEVWKNLPLLACQCCLNAFVGLISKPNFLFMLQLYYRTFRLKKKFSGFRRNLGLYQLPFEQKIQVDISENIKMQGTFQDVTTCHQVGSNQGIVEGVKGRDPVLCGESLVLDFPRALGKLPHFLGGQLPYF